MYYKCDYCGENYDELPDDCTCNTGNLIEVDDSIDEYDRMMDDRLARSARWART